MCDIAAADAYLTVGVDGDEANAWLHGSEPKDPNHQTLVGRRVDTLPPLEQVFMHGSHAVKSWLSRLGWPPDWGYNDNFKDRDVARAYEAAYYDSTPFYSPRWWVAVGGWPFQWADADEDLVGWEYVLILLRDQEPWREVWRQGSELRVVKRIT
jgi:hypothetical protein